MRTDVRHLDVPSRPWWVRLLNRMGCPVAWQPLPLFRPSPGTGPGAGYSGATQALHPLSRGLRPLPPGRDRIDPCLPYGHWAAGWERPAIPPTKKRPQAAGTTGGHGANRLATIRFDCTTKGGETQ